jgi:hypothetical protein
MTLPPVCTSYSSITQSHWHNLAEVPHSSRSFYIGAAKEDKEIIEIKAKRVVFTRGELFFLFFFIWD